jgi:hypothetical protein
MSQMKAVRSRTSAEMRAAQPPATRASCRGASAFDRRAHFGIVQTGVFGKLMNFDQVCASVYRTESPDFGAGAAILSTFRSCPHPIGKI